MQKLYHIWMVLVFNSMDKIETLCFKVQIFTA